MKVAITGHTKGIGKSLYDALTDGGHEVLGFSRSNGYDIYYYSHQKRIIEESVDCDLFINNAWNGFHQVEIFEWIYKEWQDEQKTIVNVNSRARWGKSDSPDVYRTSKRELAKKANSAVLLDRCCRIINVSPGYVYTERVKNIVGDTPTLTVDEARDIIMWAIQQPQHIEIGELSFWAITDK